MNGSVRFALLTVRLKNGTVTVALAVKNGTVKKTENGTDTVRYGHGTARTRYGTDTVRHGHGTVANSASKITEKIMEKLKPFL